jgi:hypothetical protein
MARSAKAEIVLQDQQRRFSKRPRAHIVKGRMSSSPNHPGGKTRGRVWWIMRLGKTDRAMIEILFIYQLARNPLKAIARRWYCRSLYRVSRGRRHCAECPRA